MNLTNGLAHWKDQNITPLVLRNLMNLHELLPIILIVRNLIREDQVDVLPHLNATKTEKVFVLLTKQINPFLEHKSQLNLLLVINTRIRIGRMSVGYSRKKLDLTDSRSEKCH
jgi:hypothetical protein